MTISSCISYAISFPEYTNINQEGYLTPTQIATAYNIPASDGLGVKVGIISLGGGWYSGDLANSMSNLGLPTPSITTVLVDGATNNWTADIQSPDMENTLDLYCVAGMVPRANIAIYIGQNSATSFANVINRAVNENCDVISISWAGPEYSDYLNAPLASAAAKGITVCVATGDYGSENGNNAFGVNYPATSNNVIAVGGTHLTLTSDNLRLTETVEYDDPIFYGNVGSGGGVSSLFSVPSWQTGLIANLFFRSNGYSHVSTLTGRGIPDISAPMNGYGLWFANTVAYTGGTSAATPIVAGMIARFKALTKKAISSPTYNQIFYSNTNAFFDITTGNNDSVLSQGYAATSGWDAVTGLGAPNGLQLYTALITPTVVVTSGNTINTRQIDKLLFYQTPTSTFSLNDSAGRILVGKSSGPISYSDFYGKRNSITTVFNTTSSGSFYTYTVPNQVTNLVINSISPTGPTTATLTVSPGQTLFVSIGGFGQASYIKDGSNNILYNSPAYSYQVIRFSGNVDSYLQLYVTVANPVGGSYSFSGANNGVITAAAGAYDILYTAAQGFHGDLGATVTLSPALLSTLVNTWQVATTAWTGSNKGPLPLYSEYTLGTPFTEGDGYVVEMSQNDSTPDEGNYSWTIVVQQIVPITIIANA